MRELVSILIPAYNAERWIEETIKSALNQTWPNCEIIVIDDGSSDRTFDIARRYQSKSVKVIKQENAGACVARNKALTLAQGDYIQWLDADDLLAPDKISRQMMNADHGRNSTVLLSSAFGTFYYRLKKAQFIRTRLWQDLMPVEWFVISFMDGVYFVPAAWLVSRRLTDQIGPWDERLSLNDDGEYFGRAVAASEKVKFVPDAKSYYRKANVGSLSNSKTQKALKSLFLQLDLCYGYLLALENSERTRTSILKNLQLNLIYFYPDHHEILGKIDKLSRQLGGSLTPPRRKLEFNIIKQLFGWKMAKKLAVVVSRFKRKVFIEYDRLMSILDR